MFSSFHLGAGFKALKIPWCSPTVGRHDVLLFQIYGVA
jgi:hypothetical protein